MKQVTPKSFIDFLIKLTAEWPNMPEAIEKINMSMNLNENQDHLYFVLRLKEGVFREFSVYVDKKPVTEGGCSINTTAGYSHLLYKEEVERQSISEHDYQLIKGLMIELCKKSHEKLYTSLTELGLEVVDFNSEEIF